MGRIKLRGDAWFEDAIVKCGRDAVAIVNDGDEACAFGALGCKEDVPRARISGITQKLDDDILA